LLASRFASAGATKKEEGRQNDPDSDQELRCFPGPTHKLPNFSFEYRWSYLLPLKAFVSVSCYFLFLEKKKVTKENSRKKVMLRTFFHGSRTSW
jgi:hypothetical protein